MIMERFTHYRTKSLRKDKILRDHDGTTVAIWKLNPEISSFDTLSPRRLPGMAGPMQGPGRSSYAADAPTFRAYRAQKVLPALR